MNAATKLISLTELVDTILNLAKNNKPYTTELDVLKINVKEFQSYKMINPRSIEVLAVKLWNLAIVESRKDNLFESHSKLRILACQLIELTLKIVNAFDLQLISTSLKFCSQTILVLLESLNNEEELFTLIEISSKHFNRIKETVKEHIPKHIQIILLSYHSAKANWLWRKKEQENSFKEFLKAKELLNLIPEEAYTLSMALYNSALKLSKQEDYEEAVHWLQQAIEIFDLGNDLDPSKQSRSLRLLSNCYMKINKIHEAHNCVKLANEKFDTMSGRFLRLKIVLLDSSSTSKEIIDVLQDIIRVPEIDIKGCLAACDLVYKENHKKIALASLIQVEEKFKNSNDLEIVWLTKLSMTLEAEEYETAMVLINDIVKQKVVGNILLNHSDCFHREIFALGVKFFEVVKNYKFAIEWFTKSLEFLDLLNKLDIAKVYRWLARCQLEMYQLEAAKENIKMAEEYGGENICTQYIKFLVALESPNSKELTSIINVSSKMKSVDFTLCIEVMAQAAYDKGNYNTSIEVLEKLLQSNELLQESGKYGQILCNWVHLNYCNFQKNLDVIEPPSIIMQLQSTTSKIETLGIEAIFGSTSETSLKYLSGVCWNIGLKVREHRNWNEALQFFEICATFAMYRIETRKTIQLRINASLMESTCLIQIVQVKKDGELDFLINQYSKILSTSRELMRKATSIGINTQKWKGIMEYLDFVMLNFQESGELIQRLNNLSTSSNITPTLLENLIELPKLSTKSSKEILRTEIRLLLLASNIEWKSVCRAYRKLIDITEIQDLKLYEEIFNTFSSRIYENSSVISVDLEWFAIRSWNIGVCYLRRSFSKNAEQWLSMGIKLAKLHPDSANLYDNLMKSYQSNLQK